MSFHFILYMSQIGFCVCNQRSELPHLLKSWFTCDLLHKAFPIPCLLPSQKEVHFLP